ncbi:MAG: pyridoxamine 5'-phosphate oxidase family protein [Prevotella sp.]|nr:pyridoxamine 5'-phosphate oxidase family protein [Prevotella sp.]
MQHSQKKSLFPEGMMGAEKVAAFLSQARVFDVATSVDGQPKVRPFSYFIYNEQEDRIIFSTGKFKNVYKQLLANPKIEIFARVGMTFMRYDGIAKTFDDQKIVEKVWNDSPGIGKIYRENGWEGGLFYLENGHVEIRESLYPVEEFDV